MSTKNLILILAAIVFATIATTGNTAIRKPTTGVSDTLSKYPQFTAGVSINDQTVRPGDKPTISGPHINISVSNSSGHAELIILVGPVATAMAVLPNRAPSPQAPTHYLLKDLAEAMGTGNVSAFVLRSADPFTLQQNPFLTRGRQAGTDVLAEIQYARADLQVSAFEFSLQPAQSDLQYSQSRMMQELSNRADELETNSNSSESAPLIANDIQFATNSATLNDKGIRQLDVLGRSLEQLRQQGEVFRITLEGHTDDTGEADYNQSLSEKRADSARRYLLDYYQLPETSIVSRGRGEWAPIVNSTSASARAKNRRVEIRVSK